MTNDLNNFDNWSGELKGKLVSGVLIFGEIGWEDVAFVLDACRPTLVKVGMLNPNETMIKDVLAFDVALKIGLTIEPVVPQLVVYTRKDRLTVIDDCLLKQAGADGFTQLYSVLLPWNGHSLHSSVADVSRARHKLINLRVKHAQVTTFPEMSLSLPEVKIIAICRNISLGFGLLSLFTGLLVIDSLVLGLLGGLSLVTGIFLDERTRRLRREHGGFHA